MFREVQSELPRNSRPVTTTHFLVSATQQRRLRRHSQRRDKHLVPENATYYMAVPSAFCQNRAILLHGRTRMSVCANSEIAEQKKTQPVHKPKLSAIHLQEAPTGPRICHTRGSGMPTLVVSAWCRTPLTLSMERRNGPITSLPNLVSTLSFTTIRWRMCVSNPSFTLADVYPITSLTSPSGRTTRTSMPKPGGGGPCMR